MSDHPRSHRKLVIAGAVFAALGLVLPVLGLVALVIGIIAITVGRRRAGAVIVAVSVLCQLALIGYRVRSESMAPTLEVGERVRVLGDRVDILPRLSDPEARDLVVVEPPAGALTSPSSCGVAHGPEQACPRAAPQRAQDVTFIQRVIAVGGDRVRVLDGRAYVNGERQDEPYITPDAECETCDLPRDITVPPGHVFTMGDNRGQSADGREWGPIPADWVVGDVVLRYWPPSRAGGI
jgi:signal peptidase I